VIVVAPRVGLPITRIVRAGAVEAAGLAEPEFRLDCWRQGPHLGIVCVLVKVDAPLVSVCAWIATALLLVMGVVLGNWKHTSMTLTKTGQRKGGHTPTNTR
jgi:hypothetical protein